VLDDGNGFPYMRARTYSPRMMRFLQPDYFLGSPLRTQTLNRYSYVVGNPLQGVDPLGLDTMKIVGGVLGGVVGGLLLGGIVYGLSKSGAFSALGGFFSGLFPSSGYGSVPDMEIPLEDMGSEAPELGGEPTPESNPEVPGGESGVPGGQQPFESLSSSSRSVNLGRSVLRNRFRDLSASEVDSLSRVGEILKAT
jgi:RHS repeat-associated protein